MREIRIKLDSLAGNFTFRNTTRDKKRKEFTAQVNVSGYGLIMSEAYMGITLAFIENECETNFLIYDLVFLCCNLMFCMVCTSEK